MERRMTGGLYPAIVQSELEKVKVVLPPLDVQAQLVQRVQEARTEIARERERATELMFAASDDVEAMILGTKIVV
jgi:hypothetical protein